MAPLVLRADGRTKSFSLDTAEARHQDAFVRRGCGLGRSRPATVEDPRMKVLIAPDSFKEGLSAEVAADANGGEGTTKRWSILPVGAA